MVFTDSPSTNFPASQADLDNRLKKIEQMIANIQNDSRINIHFNEAAFKLMHDCNLITQENVNFLRSAQACKGFDTAFNFPFNPDEGALRLPKNNTDTSGADGYQRFRPKKTMYLICKNQQYFISNDWYPHNKQAFHKWLKEKAQAAFDNKGKLQTASNNLEDIFESDILESKAPTENIEDEQHVLISVKDLNDLIESVKILNDKVDDLTVKVLNDKVNNQTVKVLSDKVDDLTAQIKELNDILK